MGQNAIGRSGVVTQTGTGTKIEHNTKNAGFAPWPVKGVTTLGSETVTAGQVAGVNVISGSSARTVVLPSVASSVGGFYTFRAGSAHAHILTASADDAGSLVLRGSGSISTGAERGTKLTFGGEEGEAVLLHSTGVTFMVLGITGSMGLSGG